MLSIVATSLASSPRSQALVYQSGLFPILLLLGAKEGMSAEVAQLLYDYHLLQDPTDVQNLVNQVKCAALPPKESKRVKVDRGAGEAKGGAERVVAMLRQFSETEVVLYLKSLEGKEERSAVSVV